MRLTTLKLMLTALFGFALMGISQLSFAGWTSGDCSSVSGSAPCVEYQDSNGNWHHFNGSGGHSGTWHTTPSSAPPAGADFEFCNGGEPVTLSCTDPIDVEFDCNLCLTGQVQKFQDSNNNWRIGVQVTGGQPSPGDNQCSDILANSYNWFGGQAGSGSGGTHQGFGNSTGILYNGGNPTYDGNIGTVDVFYETFLGNYQLVEQGHLHNVTYSNADSSFDFTEKTIWEDGPSDTDSSCEIDGILSLENGQELNLQ